MLNVRKCVQEIPVSYLMNAFVLWQSFFFRFADGELHVEDKFCLFYYRCKYRFVICHFSFSLPVFQLFLYFVKNNISSSGIWRGGVMQNNKTNFSHQSLFLRGGAAPLDPWFLRHCNARVAGTYSMQYPSPTTKPDHQLNIKVIFKLQPPPVTLNLWPRPKHNSV